MQFKSLVPIASLLAFSTACASTAEPGPRDPAADEQSAPPHDRAFTPDVREDFMRGCVASSGEEATCTCVLAHIEREFAQDDLATGTIPDAEIARIIEICMGDR